MELCRIIFTILCFVLVNSLIFGNKISKSSDISYSDTNKNRNNTNIDNVFNDVYTECFMHLSYPCLQRKTLLYLKELNKLSEVSIIGNYVKFVKLNEVMTGDRNSNEDSAKVKNSKDLSFMIDKSVDNFFSNHLINFSIMGRNISVPHTVDEFVGRKRRKGGGSGGGSGGGHGGDDGGKKKMMMMAMMCMKMKLMMMVPAMMGMLGMMSFKGMMFSMMSFMIAKIMLLMKILEKKGGGSGGGGGGGDGGWAAGGGGGGAWMPAGGQDYAGGGGGGGYDANAQWQSRSILENDKVNIDGNNPIISYVKPVVRYNHIINSKKAETATDKTNAEILIIHDSDKPKSRKKRGIIDVIQNSYLYWVNKILGINYNRRTNLKYPKFKIVNGVKYIYQPYRMIQKPKPIKEPVNLTKTADEGFRPIITAEDFNKGEIIEGSIESRMNRKKFHKMKDSVNDTMDDNPWE